MEWFFWDCLIKFFNWKAEKERKKWEKSENKPSTDQEYYEEYADLIEKYDSIQFASLVMSQWYRYEKNPYVMQRIDQLSEYAKTL